MKTLVKARQSFKEIPPNAARTMAALREMGYDSYAAVMDLIDNSIDAGAMNIDLNIREGTSKAGMSIDIADNGKGMDQGTLAEALRLGSDTEHTPEHLGKFGMGLVTASISMARSVWVLTRQEGKTAYEAHFDLDTIARENRFVIRLHAAESSRKVLDLIGDKGTLVRVENIDRISDTNASRFAQKLRDRLGQVYRHYLEAGVKITVNSRLVKRYDPLMLDHPATEVVLDTTLDLGDGTKATLKVVELPELGTSGEGEAGIFPHNSGFYVVRNRREIIAGETFGFYRHHHSYSHFRAELAYTGTSTVFHEDIKKASIHPDDRLLERLRKLTEPLWIQSGQRGRERGEAVPLNLASKAAEQTIASKFAPVAEPAKNGRKEKEATEAPAPPVEFSQVPATAGGRFFHAEKKDGRFVIYMNSKHPLVQLVADQKQRQAAAVLNWIAFALARAELESKGDAGKMMEKAGDYLAVLASPGPVK